MNKKTDVSQAPKPPKASSKLHYPFGKLTQEGELVELFDGIFIIRMPLHIGIAYINLYVLEDDDGWFLIDTGLPNEPTQSYWHKVLPSLISRKPVKGIICTHFHYDHAGLAQFLVELCQAPLYMTYGEYYFLRSVAVEDKHSRVSAQSRFMAEHGAPQEEVTVIAEANLKDPFVEFVPERFIRLQDQQVFEIGARQWEIKIGSGHSPEHACLFSAGPEHILISGDQLLPQISSNIFVHDTEPMANPLAEWFTALDWLKELPLTTHCLPAHGNPFQGVADRVDELEQHHQRALRTILDNARYEHQFTAHDAMRWLFPNIHRPVDLILALSEMIAHCNYLCESGQLVRISTESGIYFCKPETNTSSLY